MNTKELEEHRDRVTRWWAAESTTRRWSSLRVKALIFQLFMLLETSVEAYDRIAQRCDPAGDTQMLHEAQERADALYIKRNEELAALRQLIFNTRKAHIPTCRRIYIQQNLVWDIDKCARCRGEQMLEDLYITFEAEERNFLKSKESVG